MIEQLMISINKYKIVNGVWPLKVTIDTEFYNEIKKEFPVLGEPDKHKTIMGIPLEVRNLYNIKFYFDETYINDYNSLLDLVKEVAPDDVEVLDIYQENLFNDFIYKIIFKVKGSFNKCGFYISYSKRDFDKFSNSITYVFQKDCEMLFNDFKFKKEKFLI